MRNIIAQERSEWPNCMVELDVMKIPIVYLASAGTTLEIIALADTDITMAKN